MPTRRIGKLEPRYSFLLNEHVGERLSVCPRCRKQTHARKFALLVHVDKWGPLAMGKTCIYCTLCELIIVHQKDLEAELAESFGTLAPEVIGNKYLVLGTVDKRVWKQGLGGAGQGLQGILEHTADFKTVLKLHVDPGGWRPGPPRNPQKGGKRRK